MRKQLIVCGDSFMSPVITFPGTHFTEIFAKELDFELTIFARSGMSNGGIAIQLESAIERKPDLIIFSTTSFDRIEIPLKTGQSSFIEDYGKHYPFYNTYDLLYTQAVGKSTLHPAMNQNPKLLSMSLADLLNITHYDSSLDPYKNHNSVINLQFVDNFDTKKDVLKEWFYYLYDERWKNQVDNYILFAMLYKLHWYKIPFLWVNDSVLRNLPEHIGSIIPPQYDLRATVGHILGSQFRPKGWKDPGYHTDFETQQKAAQIVIEHYKNNLI